MKFMGVVKHKNGNYAEAIKDFDGAIKLYDYDHDTWKYRGDCKRRLGDFKGALEDFQIAEQIEPMDSWTLKNIGDIKRRFGDYEGAMEYLNKADKRKPDDVYTLKIRGETKRMLNDFRGSLRDLNEANRLKPNDSWTLKERGATKRMLGDFHGALEDFNNADKVRPNDSFTLKGRGFSKRVLGDYNGALEDLNVSDQLRPNDFITLLERGTTKRMLGDLKGSLEDLKRSDELQPSNRFIRDQLVLTLMAINNSQCEWKMIFPSNALFEIEGTKYIDLLKLSPISSEFEEVNEKYLKSIREKNPNFLIFSAQWIENESQEQLFNHGIELEKRRIEQNPTDNSLSDEQNKILSQFSRLWRQTNHSEKVSILKVWHGTSQEKAESIMKLGFMNAATLDEGWFGKGVYFTTDIEYAIKYSKISSKSEDELCLLCCYVILSNPFPITKEIGLTFSGKGNYEQFQSHVVLVKSDPNDPNSMPYHPSSIDDHQFKEIVLFQESHILPRLRVVLKKETNPPSQIPSNSSNASSWTIDEVCEWISKIGLSQDYSSSIRIHSISGKALSTFKTKEDWKEVVSVEDTDILCLEWNKLKFD